MTKQDAIRWTQLLEEAVTKPGIISQAYRMFHGYSIGNRMLALFQMLANGIEPGPMAGYKKWQSLGRQVQKGQKAIGIWIPVTYKVKDEETDEEETRLTFKWRHCVFAISQTEGEDQEWPELPSWDRQAALTNLDIAEVAFDTTDGNCQGFAINREVAVNPVAAFPMKTFVHELAHVELGHTAEGRITDNDRTPRDLRELEAEGVAYIVTNALELDGQAESRGYIQHWWGEGNEVPERSARRIFATAEKILAAGTDAS